MIKKVLTMGETLIRLNFNPDDLYDGNKIEYFFGGDALNVASILGINGNKTYYLSALNEKSLFTKKLKLFMNSNLVKSQFVYQNSYKLGKYFYSPINPDNSSKVEYDRTNTCFSNLDLDQNELNKINDKNFDLIHLSGISLAINPELVLKITKSLNNSNSL
ncbi:PfkB family carbohydrate kinase, partial [Mycoplasmopsis alligatoris]